MIDRGRYLVGDCAVIALALHQITGWPVVVMIDPYHVLVRVPGTGQLLDAAGLHPPDCLDGFCWREMDGEELDAQHDRRVTAEVVADARELLDSLSAMPPGEVAPFPWRSRDGRVASGDLARFGLVASG